MDRRVSTPTGQAELEHAMLVAMTQSARPENAAALSSQIPRGSVTNRDFSGVGCFTEFHIDDGVIDFPRSTLDGVGHIILEDFGLMSGARFPSGLVATFQICIEQGRLKVLEGLTLDGEPWPDDVSKFEIV